MIKELLLVILFLKGSHGNDFSTRCGESQSLENANDSLLEADNEMYNNCMLDWEKISLSERICITGDDKKNLQLNPVWPLKASLVIKISNFQIIQIDSQAQALTMSLNMEMLWLDCRLIVDLDQVGNARIHLNNDEEKLIWSPQIGIAGNIMSNIKEEEEIGLIKTSTNFDLFKKFYRRTTVICDMDFKTFPFDKHTCNLEFEDANNETIIHEIKLDQPKLRKNTNNYNVHHLEIIQQSNVSTKFDIKIYFERNLEGINSVLINYHLICAMLVLLGSINFLFDPKDTNRSCMLVALLLVLATIFSLAQGDASGFTALTIYILICMVFLAMAMVYHGIILFILRKIKKIKDAKMAQNDSEDVLSNSIIKLDRLMLVIYGIIFALFNVSYFMIYYFK